MPGTQQDQWRARFQMSRDNLDLLKVLTDKLPPLPMNPSGEPTGAFYRYPTRDGKGSVLAWKLLSLPGIAIAQFFMSKGSSYPEHGHEIAKEWVIVYEGRLSVTVDGSVSCGHIVNGQSNELVAGDCVHFERGQIHSAVALEDTWMVAITIPRDSAYPE